MNRIKIRVASCDIEKVVGMVPATYFIQNKGVKIKSIDMKLDFSKT